MEIPPNPRHRRRARAEGRVRLESDAAERLDDSVFNEARVAGVLAARRAAAVLPRTADAELTTVEVGFDRKDRETLAVDAFVEGYARSGLGTRAMLGVQGGSAHLVDVCSSGAVTLRDAEVVMERGGLDSLEYDFEPPIRASVLTISDAVASGAKEDAAGRLVRNGVEDLASHGVDLGDYEVLPDDRRRIADAVEELVERGHELIVTVGGTGLTHTDATVEAVEPLLDREVPGLAEAMRGYGQEQTPVAFMSRGIAGLVGEALVVTLPGSTAGAREAIEAVFPALLHVCKTRRKSREELK